MAQNTNPLAELLAACADDQALKERLKADPKAVLAEHHLHLADEQEVLVREQADGTLDIKLSGTPEDRSKLSDEELSKASGGIDIASGNESEGAELDWSSNITWD